MKTAMSHWQRRTLGPAILGLAGVLMVGMAGLAKAQKVSADLSQEFTGVGQPVQLNISVVGGRGAQVPQNISVDGLDVRFAGRSEQVNVVNFQMTVSSIYSYLVVPMRTGDFTIPAVAVNVGGRTIKTQPLRLRVGGNSGGVPVMPAIPVRPPSGGRSTYPPPSQSVPQQPSYPPSQSMPQQQDDPSTVPEDKLVFGELIIPKKYAYVGEVVPVEIRFYFLANVPVQVRERPTFTGDGFTVLDFSKPDTKVQDVDDRTYNVVVFRTAITAVKAGTLEVSPASIEAQARFPGQAPQGLDDFLSSFLANSGIGSNVRELNVQTKPVRLEVKALPAEGKPADFTGAIGQFSLTDSATPKKADAGDPIVLEVKVAGRGNFNAFTAPTLQDAEAWRSYPPSEEFRASPSDPIGYNGEKVFKYMIVARTDATATPVPEFTFFDPAVEKYVTLKGGAVPVVAKGGGSAAPAAGSVAAAPKATPTPAVAPEAGPTPASSDLLAQAKPGTFEPVALRRVFVISNAVAALGWLAIAAFALVRTLARSEMARRSGWRREQKKILHELSDPKMEGEEFFREAEHFIRARLAPEGSTRDTRDLVEGAALAPATREALLELLSRGDEYKYAAGTAAARLGADTREELLKHLNAFDEEIR